MKKLKKKFTLLIILIVAFTIIYVHNIFKVYPNSQYSNIFSTNSERRGTPPYSWFIDNNFFPHMKVFFWVPKDTKKYIPFADTSVKTYISRHGDISKWDVNETGNITKTEKEVYLLVPKSFVLLHGSNFYKLIHLYYK